MIIENPMTIDVPLGDCILEPGELGIAIYSPCRLYRYFLTRKPWGEGGVMAFGMLNPSTAGPDENDPTVTRCIGYAKKTPGIGSLVVVNLFALRSTDPKRLLKVGDPTGPRNREYLAFAAQKATIFVCAWGALSKQLRSIARLTIGALKEARQDLKCLAKTDEGHPRHPLYLKGELEPQPWP